MEVEERCLSSCCSDWMSEMPSRLWDTPLWNLAIPGSHDTMTYCLDQKSSVLKSAPKLLQALDTCFPCIVRPCIIKWGTTQVSKLIPQNNLQRTFPECSYLVPPNMEHKRQNLITTNSLSHLYCIFATTMEDSISKQLDLGIRFLDLRIAHKTKDPNEVFYFAHGIYSLQTVKEALINVAHWLDQHNKEVVIIALSAFDGMNPDQHRDLIQFLISTFNNRICPNHVTPSLQECWNHSYQVILSYDDSAASGHEELWPQCEYWWANTSDPNRLVSYLEERKEEGRPDMFFAAGLNLTEDARYIITHPCQSMQSMTLNSYGLLFELGQAAASRLGQKMS